jgi:hypothetical protein
MGIQITKGEKFVLYVRVGEITWNELHREALKNEETVANVTRRILREWQGTREGERHEIKRVKGSKQ